MALWQRRFSRSFLAVALLLLPAGLRAAAPAGAGEEVTLDSAVLRLDNGMTFLLIDRPAPGFVAAGWVVRAGSGDDPAGQTGLSHLLEHMLYKGTRTIGTTDVERELPMIAEQDDLRGRLRRLKAEQGRASGEAAEALTREVVEVEERLRLSIERQRALLVPDEYDRIYGRAGALSINAFTTPEMTAYFASVPANRLELWFWMESDRLLAPVFRGLHAEHQVIAEERRRLESGPTATFATQFEAMFWQEHPYRWPRIGWPADVEALTVKDAQRHFQSWYVPGNLTAVLVGRFDRAKVTELARRYFGRLPAAPEPVRPPMPALGPPAETRLLASCNCPPQVEVRYHTMPFLHTDADALTVLAAVLNGRAGRLQKALIDGAKVASRASAEHSALSRGGFFGFRAAAGKAEISAEQLEQAWYDVVGRLQREPIPAGELERTKDALVTDLIRRLEEPFGLMTQLLTTAGRGNWQYLLEQPKRMRAVTAADLQRVAQTYFRPENRTVALYRRNPAAPEPDGAAEP
jgi:predicted Zn-dependent peptidase